MFAGLVAVGILFLRGDTQFSIIPPDRIVAKEIPKGTAFALLALEAGIGSETVSALLESSKNAHDLATIVSGKNIEFIFDRETDALKALRYALNSDEELRIDWMPEQETWRARVRPIAYDIQTAMLAGVIDSSLYGAIVENKGDERLALALAEAFAWQIDFAADIRKGDSFKVIYEARYLEGGYHSPGRVLAAEFTNDGKTFRGYYFESAETKAGHYDDDGNSLQKEFLKSPLQYKYISSGFSYARVNPVTKKVAPHRGIDYAANYGTPAVSVGNGTVVQAGWNGPYGISALIRHNDTYQTRYGHFQSLAKGIRVGAKVTQGQVVGYVGSTGQSTGPHLHYEMHKFGSHVNPFTVEIPPGEPINESDRDAFEKIAEEYRVQLSRP